MYLLAKKFVDSYEQQLNKSDDVISRKKVYFVAFRKHQDFPSHRKIFANKDDALIYWQEMGKDKYSYWEEYIYG